MLHSPLLPNSTNRIWKLIINLLHCLSSPQRYRRMSNCIPHMWCMFSLEVFLRKNRNLKFRELVGGKKSKNLTCKTASWLMNCVAWFFFSSTLRASKVSSFFPGRFIDVSKSLVTGRKAIEAKWQQLTEHDFGGIGEGGTIAGIVGNQSSLSRVWTGFGIVNGLSAGNRLFSCGILICGEI